MNEFGKESKVIMLQEALQFKEPTIMYYNTQIGLVDSMCNPFPFTWHISQITIESFCLLLLIFAS
jgi:hypothetical protein